MQLELVGLHTRIVGGLQLQEAAIDPLGNVSAISNNSK
jgi:hypothetical protein